MPKKEPQEMGTEDNYIIDPGDIDYARLRDLLQSIGQPSVITDLSGETLVVETEGNCSWFIRIRDGNQIVFTGIGHFLPEYSEVERWRLLNGANSEAKLSRFSFLGERALAISYTLMCTSGLPTKLFLDSWQALQQEQGIFTSWLRDITPAERADSLPERPTDPPSSGAAGDARTSRPRNRSDIRDFMLGCLFGGAVGDAMGAPVAGLDFDEMEHKFGAGGVTRFEEAHGGYGKVTGNTQMALFTLEALLRSRMRMYDQGMVKPAEVYFNAYLRWAKTQGISIKDYRQTRNEEAPGWLVFSKELQQKRSPDQKCLRALADANRQGTLTHPINNSKGFGGLVRAAPAGFFDTHPGSFEQGCRLAAVTDGHPTGYLSGGFLAELITRLRLGLGFGEARDAVLERLRLVRNSTEVTDAVERAADAASSPGNVRERIEALGTGMSAAEVLAVSLYCAEKSSDFREGVLMAVNHSGNSCVTGAVTGGILGAVHGYNGLCEQWRDQVELRELMFELVDDAIDIYARNPGLDRFWKKYPPC